MPLRYICYDCGSRGSDGSGRCGCGEPLWLDTSPDAFDWDDIVDAPGLWRYEPLLPASLPSPPSLAAAAGGTPLLRDDALDSFVGASVHLKLEGQQPTGSFKDRGSALALAAMEAGLLGESEAIGTVSHGNMAMSTAAFAAAFDRPCVVLVPDDIPPERLGVIGQFDPTILRVRGDYGRLYERSLELGSEYGIRFVNSDSPLRVEGQKTTALELCEAFAPSTPDGIVLPVSSGGHASGVWKALGELRAAGVIDDLPALHLVQAAACAPIAEAFAADEETVSAVEGGETIAYSIANADPPSGTRALRAVRDTGGAALSVDDDAIRSAQRQLATGAGVSVETSGAVALAGAKQLVADGVFTEDDDVAVVATGTGLTEASADVSAPAVDLAALDGLLAEFAGR
ncbi:pyridoxal-phosphate dependent enzyme [Natronomonas sp. CBA1123]|uniref:threonine synthase n=1 Tax=Natronomonas sp. CBA1123 TaxID=2668070 RepID=UPI0012EAB50B|nr:pyridoxal-phosphate dependent enzyme [Natronomonas sp. CBA1123]MUV86788.1 pyridoxal-phosphate dependent enzyme [Natronomonas sp. CBA1123]